MSDTQQHNAAETPDDLADNNEPLKTTTARVLKWNLADRLASQVLYGVTGIILARLLTPDDFGLVGAMLVFQAFANMFIDSGFWSALIQRKSPTQLDYSTVMWFNMAIACGIYAILYICAPGIASLFDGDLRIIALSRVMFLSFILNAASLVQANRLTKQMNVRPLTIADIVSLTVGGATGIWLAYAGAGAWAIVWQTIVYHGVRSGLLWCMSRWRPSMMFSWQALRSFMHIGSSVLATSFLNVLFQNIYSFFIGNRAGLGALGYYTQGDKWSKMGVMSLSSTMTASFLPVLSGVQDDAERYRRVSTKINRFALYCTLPSLGLLTVLAPAIFHCLFGTKWDAAIALFQLLCIRGIFTLLTLQYNNCVVSLGRARAVVMLEVLRDSVALVALFITLPYLALSYGDDITYGIRLMVIGQLIASAVTWLATLIYTARLIGLSAWSMLRDGIPYLGAALIACTAAWACTLIIANPWLLLLAQSLTGAAIYISINALAGSVIQRDVLTHLFNRKR